MKLTDEQIEVIAKECNFDMTGRLLRFARLLLESSLVEVPATPSTDCIFCGGNGLMGPFPGGEGIDCPRCLGSGREPTLVAQALPIAEDEATPAMGKALKEFIWKAGYLRHPDVEYRGTANGDNPEAWYERYFIAAAQVVIRAGLGEAKAVAPIGFIDPNTIDFLKNGHLTFTTLRREVGNNATAPLYAAPVSQALPAAEDKA